VLSAHPIIGRGIHRVAAQKVKLEMAVRGKNVHYLINQIQRRHWIAQGQRVGFSEADVEEMIGELTARTMDVIDEVSGLLPNDFPLDVAGAIFDGVQRLNRTLALST
jgi:serine/threonine-protein kinase HipA